MFEIEYKGANGIVITSKHTTLVVDPKLSLAGLKDVAVKNAVELGTEERFLLRAEQSQLALEGPGEYEVGDFSIRGVAAQRHIDAPGSEPLATIYRVEVQGVHIAVIGNVAPRLSDEQLEQLGVIDILIVPVGGGGYTLDATSATGMVRQVEPKVVIPVHYADEAAHYEVPQDTAETFTKELGAPVESVAKYKIKSAQSLPEALTVVQLARSA